MVGTFISQTLTHRAEQAFSSLWSNQVTKSTSPLIRDVAVQVEEFKTDLGMAREGHAPIPSLVVGDVPIPMDMAEFAEMQGVVRPGSGRAGAQSRQEAVSRLLETKLLQNPGEGFVAMDPDRAERVFKEGATDFLHRRLTGEAPPRPFGAPLSAFDLARDPDPITLKFRNPSTGKFTKTKGTVITVATNTPGLRVLWSGAYRISPNLFSGPTSPVQSVLTAGTYVFGVDGGPYPSVQWDQAGVISLPGPVTSIHLNF